MGQAEHRVDILNVTNANPCVVSTTEEHGFVTGQFVRITDLNGDIPTNRGMTQLNNLRFKIVKLSDTSFYLKHPITDANIDSTGYTPYVEGGSCNRVETEFYYTSEDEDG